MTTENGVMVLSLVKASRTASTFASDVNRVPGDLARCAVMTVASRVVRGELWGDHQLAESWKSAEQE